MCSNSSMKLAMKRNRELSAIWRGKSKVTNSFGYFTLIASSTARWDYSTVYNRQGKGHFCYKWINWELFCNEKFPMKFSKFLFKSSDQTCPMIAKIILQKHDKIMRVLSERRVSSCIKNQWSEIIEPIWDGSYMKLDLMAMYVYNHKKIMLGVNLSA